MKGFERDRYEAGSRSGRAIDAFSLFFSYYAVPVAIGLLSLFALFYPGVAPIIKSGTPLSVRVLRDPADRLDAPAARAALSRQPWLRVYDTHLDETPIWFEVAVRESRAVGADRGSSVSGASSVVSNAPLAGPASAMPPAATPLGNAPLDIPEGILFPSRHIQQIKCFDGTSLSPIGSASANLTSSDELTTSGSGISVLSSHHDRLLCRALFSGPAMLSAMRSSVIDLKYENDIFHRRAGLLEGGLATLAAFVLLTALINRDWVYVLFAAWLMCNLRLGAISMGWDEQWLGAPLPTHWIGLIRKITVPVYYILTFTLFQVLFKTDLPRLGFARLLKTLQWLGLVLLVASIVLPVPLYLPVMWGIASFAIAMMIFLLARLLVVSPSRIALWYSAALATALIASFSEVATAVFNLRAFIPGFNSVTAALISSLMAALAIAEQIRAERAERLRAQAELRRAYDVTPVGLFTLGHDGSFVRFNPALDAMLEMGGDTRGRHWDDYFETGSWQPIYRKALETGAVEVELTRGAALSIDAGGTGPAEDVVTAPGVPDNRRHYLVKAAFAGMQLEGSVQDITERQRAIQTLGFLADHDPLTGALNRRGIDRCIIDMSPKANPTGEASGEAGRSLVLGYLDLDRFKLINDLFGHHTGDEVLKQVYLRIEAELARLGGGGCVGRIGGDEFVILFGAMQLEEARAVAQRIIDAIDADAYQIGRRAFHVRASLGMVEPPPGLRAQDTISAADSACREAKANGNGRVVVYGRNAPMFIERARDLSLIERFSGELPLGRLFLEMQPIMSLKTPYEALDFEVLLRMRGPDGKVIPPVKVIAAAEANGSISALDKWVMETTLHWIEANLAQLSRTRFVSVNVSGASLNDERFVADIGVLLSRYRRVVPLLCIEITEGVALHDLDNTRRLVSGVQRLGAKVALDDFGAGYTSFPYLRDLPADALKIDGNFVKNMSELSANAAIVDAIVGLARNLGMQSIAEWVEDARTLEILQAMRVDYVQGYAIARPQSPEVILAAHSAADFITDPAVLALIGPNTMLLPLDDGPPRPLH
ncbi:MAG: putative bifunctional diguanylate cyclase/phosphodiesterase [Janthinobacterium lividum]